MNLTELKTLREKYIEQAMTENIPDKVKMIAQLGEVYLSNRHGLYQIFPILYQDKTAVIINHPDTGKLIEHGKWEQLDRVSVFITKRFNPLHLDKHSNLPIFWAGDCAMRWTISDVRTEPLPTDIFIPGDWWVTAQKYIKPAKDEIKKTAKSAQEAERQRLKKELLIGVKI